MNRSLWNRSLAVASILVIGLEILFTANYARAALGDQMRKLLASDGAMFDNFGRSVSVSGQTAIVGSWQDDDNGNDSGSAYLFNVANGSQLAKLKPNDGAASDLFGVSVAISGNRAIVGSVYDDDNGDSSGSAYLFDVTNGSQLAKLKPSDGAEGDNFGLSVAISGGTAIVGSNWDDDKGRDSGSAYLFDVTTGAQLAKLKPSDLAGGDEFGWSVGISGNTAIVGAWLDDDNGFNSGSAYLFDVTTGTQLAKLKPTDGSTGDYFGWSVAISGNTAIVGAYADGDNGIDSGSAYLFDITTGAQFAKLKPSDGAAGDGFGISVDINAGTAIIGAYLDDDNGLESGSAYLFDVSTGLELTKLTPSDGARGDIFGLSVGLNGNAAIVGAFRDNDIGLHSGSAYLFDAPIPEPSTVLICALASVGMLMGRRR